MMQKIVIFKAEDTGRYHSVIFKPSPKPSEYDDAVQRHLSMAHHTLGFDSFELALQDSRDFAERQIEHGLMYSVHDHLCIISAITSEQIQIYLPVQKEEQS